MLSRRLCPLPVLCILVLQTFTNDTNAADLFDGLGNVQSLFDGTTDSRSFPRADEEGGAEEKAVTQTPTSRVPGMNITRPAELIYASSSAGVNESTMSPVTTSEAPALSVTRTSNSTGYVTSPGYDGIHKYGYDVNSTVDLDVPGGFVVMVSFPHLDISANIQMNGRFGDGPASFASHVSVYLVCEDFVSLAFKYTGEITPPPSLHNCSLRIHFESFKNAGNFGFKMLFSLHPVSTAPSFLDNGLLDCSVPHYDSFKQHVQCNLEPECPDGKDERDCSFSSASCDKGSASFLDKCLVFASGREKLTWDAANDGCFNTGGRLVTLNTPSKLSRFREAFRAKRILFPVYVGAAYFVDTAMPMFYSPYWQWRDKTIALNLNISFDCDAVCFGFRGPSDRYCSLYIPQSPEILYAAYCDRQITAHFACEMESDGPSASLPTKNQLRMPSLPSYVSRPEVDIVTCESGHFTHDFLFCDPASRCGDLVYLTSCHVPGKGAMPKFECDNSRVTLPYTLVCDFRPDCPDDSDERFCRHEVCSIHSCSSGKCYTPEQWCDHIPHCEDLSDEINAGCDYGKVGAKSILQGAHYAEDLANRSPATGIVRLNLKTGGSTNILTVDPLEQDTPCPEDHFQCPSGHCIPLLLRCNAVYDCPGHEDESGCGRYTCPGFYRCRGSNVCVHPSWLCDGVPHCPQGDDEWLCDRPSTCPPGCRCQGLAFVCPRPFPVHGFPHLRYLDASGSGLAPCDFTTCWYLVNLVLADCRLDHITPVSLPNLR